MMRMLCRVLQIKPTTQIPLIRSMASATNQDVYFYSGEGLKMSKHEYLQKLCSLQGGVILIGENHMDPASHSLELDILNNIHSTHKQSSSKVALSLEFYDRSAQVVLDEYLAGLVSKEAFLEDGGAPGNYQDYQPLIDYCQQHKLPVIAANCPRRYTRLVAQHGRHALQHAAMLGAHRFLPPLPYAGASPGYIANFMDVMKSLGNDNPQIPTNKLDAQALWDATMAHSIAENLHQNDIIVHMCGYFHIKNKLGICEHMAEYCPGVSMSTTVIIPQEEPGQFNSEEHAGVADFVVLTDINQIP